VEFTDKRQTAIVIASGPSANDAELERLVGWPVVVVNDCWRLYSAADILYACDHQWWDKYAADTDAFAGERVTQSKESAERYGLTYIKGEAGLGFSEQHGVVKNNHNSGAQAMQLAHQRGARRLILIGFDGGPLGGRMHWFGNHPKGLANDSPWHAVIAGHRQMAIDAERMGIEIINTSRHSAIDCYSKARLTDCL